MDKLLSENPCSAVEKLLKIDSTLEIFTPIDLALIPSLSTQSQHVRNSVVFIRLATSNQG